MAQPAQVVQLSRAAMPAVMVKTPIFRPVVVAVVQPAQELMAHRQTVDLAAAVWHQQLPEHQIHMVAEVAAASDQVVDQLDSELTEVAMVEEPLPARVAQQTEAAAVVAVVAPGPWWAVLAVQESSSFATPCPPC